MIITTLALVALTGCGEKDDDTGVDYTGWEDGGSAEDGGATGDGGTTGDGGSGDGGSGDGGSDGGSGDGGDEGGKGLLSFEGSATVFAGDSYDGTETFRFTADEGDGEVLCEVSFVLSTSAVRDDCEELGYECTWAFDVQVSGVAAKVDTMCDAVGYDSAALAALEGSTRSYGFIPEYFGHAPTLMVEEDGVWSPVAYASHDEKTGYFFYEGVDGYQKY